MYKTISRAIAGKTDASTGSAEASEKCRLEAKDGDNNVLIEDGANGSLHLKVAGGKYGDVNIKVPFLGKFIKNQIIKEAEKAVSEKNKKK